MDDLRQEVEWTRNCRVPDWHVTQPTTSIPKDALTQDFGERINAVQPQDLPTEDTAAASAADDDGDDSSEDGHGRGTAVQKGLFG